jgi:hypothetical protein
MSETETECVIEHPEHAEGEGNPAQGTKPVDIRQLKRARSSAKGILSKRQNELLEIITNTTNLPELEKKLSELNKALEKFQATHKAFHDNLCDEDDILESNDYYDAVIERVHDVRDKALQIIDNKEPDIRPEDSVSNVGSKASSKATNMSKLSKRSSSSSVLASRAKASAKKAFLEAQTASLAKRQALEEERLRIQHMTDQLDLETELAKAAAEEQVYLEADEDENFPSVSKVGNSKIEQSPKQTQSIPTEPTRERVTTTSRESSQRYQAKSIEREMHRDLSGKKLPHQLEKENNRPCLDTDLEATVNPMEQLLRQQQRHTLALMLPQPEVPIFDGDPIEYQNFIRAFETLIELKTDSNSARLYYLIQYTAGDVRELMKGCLSMNARDGYSEARRLLKQKYGQDYKIATAYMDRITNGPPIKSEEGDTLQKFSILLTSCKNTLKDIGYLSKIENPESLRKIINQLPFALRRKWRDVADRITEQDEREITIDDIATFVAKAARAASHPIFGNLNGDQKELKRGNEQNRKGYKHRETPRSNFAVDGEQHSPPPRQPTTIKCPGCDANHWLSQCPQFKGMSLVERFKLVRKKGLCDNCLTRGHLARNCPKKSFCKVQGCKEVHSTYLHESTNNEKTPRSKKDNEEHNKAESESETETKVQNGYIKSKQPRKAFVGNSPSIGLAIVPVNVRAIGGERTVQTYAFLDGGSNTSFCSEALMKQLNMKGKPTRLSLTTLGKANSKTESSIVSLELTDLQGENNISLETVFSTPELPVTTQNRASMQDMKNWPHLSNIQLDRIDAEVGLLIGSDAPEVLEPKEIRRSQDGGPYATKTIFGWVINGPLGKSGRTTPRTANFVSRADTSLEEQFKNYCDMEFNDLKEIDKPNLSREDKRAINIMSESSKLNNGHYEIALPWKKSPPDMPNNRSVAEHRLNLLKKRFEKDQPLSRKYSEFVDNLLKEGYARKVPTERLQTNGNIWYLPHHAVFHPQKPEKVRVVFDCSSRYQGTSLNDQLLQGPDLTNSLIGVLTRFRQSPIAFMADVEAMFHQVRVPMDDCDSLRFLWWPDGDTTATPEEYQMMVHLFGSISSPSCANFALKKTAEDNKDEFSPLATTTVERDFYVDDCLKSVESDQIAIPLVQELRQLLSKGGFRLTKWSSNSQNVLKSLPEAERAVSVKTLDFASSPVERALGVRWNVTSDTFGYKIVVKERPATRRGILSIVSSIYDPLGFVSPFIFSAKILLQDLCRSKLGWDDPVPEDALRRWKNWLAMLPKLEEFVIDRCLKPASFGDVVSSQIHHFADASQQGYGAVSYLRIVNRNGDVHCCFLTGKSRLAPLKATTIPRLELSAAVVATKLDKMMRQELDISPDESIFWTDSTCVLSYIQNESRRFQTFVANRISKIHDASEPTQWKYVNTKLNPADDASRGLTAEEIVQNKRWLKGPEFLWQPNELWRSQHQPTAQNMDNDPELKREATTLAATTENVDPMHRRFEKFSTWKGLKKAIAHVIRYKNRLRTKVQRRKNGETAQADRKETKINPITIDELNNAERVILEIVQSSNFPKEISTLEGQQSSNPKSESTSTTRRNQGKSSPIYKLSPRLINGLLRVGGRLNHAPLETDVKHPIILPKHHHIAKLIVRHYHQISGHSGIEYVLSLIRQKYWIVKARVLVRKVLNDCFDCRRRQSPVGEQRMADLPESRVTPCNPPFTYTGVDCFGPFNVRRGRSQVKRYGVIFTCLSVRAIHIEVAQSLDTDSFINAMRRFIARRGTPSEMRSDNGGNFVSGEKELRLCIKDWNQQKIHEFLLQREIKWIFNPPTASHHGGVWERCIRTVRKVMNALLREQTLDDEGLLTLMCEVEAIINGRPITKVSDDSRDNEALTPNHLLLLRPGSALPPGKFQKEDLYSRRRWRQIQYLADIFWRRWLKEYLPSLQRRDKWNRARRNFEIGDIVLVLQENCPRSSWPLARIVEVNRNSSDGNVRSVKVKTSTSTLERPINKIVLLEITAEKEVKKDGHSVKTAE